MRRTAAAAAAAAAATAGRYSGQPAAPGAVPASLSAPIDPATTAENEGTWNCLQGLAEYRDSAIGKLLMPSRTWLMWFLRGWKIAGAAVLLAQRPSHSTSPFRCICQPGTVQSQFPGNFTGERI